MFSPVLCILVNDRESEKQRQCMCVFNSENFSMLTIYRDRMSQFTRLESDDFSFPQTLARFVYFLYCQFDV